MQDKRQEMIYSLEWFKEWKEKRGEKEPDFNSLKPFPCLPPLLEFYNGKKVKTINEWDNRKDEIKKYLSEYFLGKFPQKVPELNNVDFFDVKKSEKAAHHFIKLTFNTKNRASINIELMIPEANGPFPVLLTQSNHRNWGLLALSRGYMVCIYPGADIDDQTNVFKEAYPECDWALIPRRAWMASRVLDYVMTLDMIDKGKIAITGHSRNGKQSLIAAAFDERISAVVSSSSGAGGACSFRYMSENYYGESVELMTKNFPEWFNPKLRFFTGKEQYLPIDNHGLLALIAPRHCLLCSAYNDDCESVFAIEQTYKEAKKVYKFLDKEEALNVRWRPGIHETGVYDVQSYIDWIEQVFGRDKINKEQNSDLITYFDWNKWKAELTEKESECSFSKKDCADNENKRQCISWFLGESPAKGIAGEEIDFKISSDYHNYLQQIGEIEDTDQKNIKRLPVYFSEEIKGVLYFNQSISQKTKTLIWLHPYSYASGHTGNYVQGEKPYEYLAERGYIVMVFDQMGFGQRVLEGKDFYKRHPKWSRLGKMVQDVSSAVDFLGPDERIHEKGIFSLIDKNHIYCAGYSLGGMVGLYATALDRRISGVASFYGFTPMRESAENENIGGLRKLWDLHSLIPKLGFFVGKEEEIPYDYQDILSLIAPRPALIVSATQDREADINEIKKCINKSKTSWRNSNNQLDHIIQHDYNRFQQKQNEILLNWLEKLKS